MFEDSEDQVSLDCKKQKCRTEEKAQQVGALTDLTDRRVLFPAPTAIWNSRFGGLVLSSDLSELLHTCGAQKLMQAYT